jgi:hypothetical protein
MNPEKLLLILIVAIATSCETEKSAWKKLQSSKKIEDYEKFINDYPKSEHASEARKKVWNEVKLRLLNKYYKSEEFRGKGVFEEVWRMYRKEEGGMGFIEERHFKSEDSIVYNWLHNVVVLIRDNKIDTMNQIELNHTLYEVSGWKIVRRDDLNANAVLATKDSLLSHYKQMKELLIGEQKELIELELIYSTWWLGNTAEKDKIEHILGDSLFFVKELKSEHN